MIMKQTLEEAAIKHQNGFSTCEDASVLGAFSNGMHHQSYKSFIAGAEWQSRQSPWISVKERLPEQNELVLCRMVSNGAIVSGYIFVEDKKPPRVATQGSFEFEDWNDYECDMWTPIPSFDEILEVNNDVLERIKERG